MYFMARGQFSLFNMYDTLAVQWITERWDWDEVKCYIPLEPYEFYRETLSLLMHTTRHSLSFVTSAHTSLKFLSADFCRCVFAECTLYVHCTHWWPADFHFKTVKTTPPGSMHTRWYKRSLWGPDLLLF